MGRPTVVSGMVLVPAAPSPGSRPLVAYAPGTQGWGDQCAPSRTVPAGSFGELVAVNGLLARGWAVVVTDYPGLGTPGPHRYNVGIAEGLAVLDALRAAVRLPPAGLDPSAPAAVAGYSQGGGAAGWAAQLQPVYAPSLPLVGVAAGGTPAGVAAGAAPQRPGRRAAGGAAAPVPRAGRPDHPLGGRGGPPPPLVRPGRDHPAQRLRRRPRAGRLPGPGRRGALAGGPLRRPAGRGELLSAQPEGGMDADRVRGPRGSPAGRPGPAWRSRPGGAGGPWPPDACGCRPGPR